MTFDWRHYIAVQLEWADCLIARAQETGRGNSESDALLGIARTRLQDVQRLDPLSGQPIGILSAGN